MIGSYLTQLCTIGVQDSTTNRYGEPTAFSYLTDVVCRMAETRRVILTKDAKQTVSDALLFVLGDCSVDLESTVYYGGRKYKVLRTALKFGWDANVPEHKEVFLQLT